MATIKGFRLSLMGAVAAGAAAVQITGPPAAQAITQIYKIGSTPFTGADGGIFQTNVGPAKAGFFDGFIRWDSTAAGGAGAWTDWLITIYEGSNQNPPGPVLFKFASSQAIYDAGKPITGSATVGAYIPGNSGCFNSSDGRAANAVGPYLTGLPGSTNCGPNVTPAFVEDPGDPGSIQTLPPGVNSGSFSLSDDPTDGISAPYCPTSLCPTNTGQDLRWLNFYQIQSVDPTGPIGNTQYQFFRYPGYLQVKNNPGSFTLLTAPNTGAIANNLGWSAMDLNPNASGTNLCTGNNSNSNPAGTCPYGGNQQQVSNVVAGTTPDLNPVEIPAPLPFSAMVPLGVALKKMSRKRKQLLQS